MPLIMFCCPSIIQKEPCTCKQVFLPPLRLASMDELRKIINRLSDAHPVQQLPDSVMRIIHQNNGGPLLHNQTSSSVLQNSSKLAQAWVYVCVVAQTGSYAAMSRLTGNNLAKLDNQNTQWENNLPKNQQQNMAQIYNCAEQMPASKLISQS